MRLVRPLSRGVVLSGVGIAALAVAGVVVAATHFGARSSHESAPAASTSSPASPAVVSVVGVHRGRVPWNRPLVVLVTNGSLRSVEVDAGSTLIDGVIGSDGTTWHSQTTLVPLTTYVATVTYSDAANRSHTQTLKVVAGDTDKHLRVTLSPGDGDTVGVGSPIVARFSRSVPVAQRANVEARLAVSVTPSVVGAWHWISDQEVHWRPPTYWKAGTKVQVSATLDNFYVGAGVWGSGSHTATFTIGDSHISRVDVARHQMYVYDNGKLVRTMPISAGRDKYPTKNGVHITFEKSQVVTMDSATVGIPRNSPDGYYEKVYWDVRISYGGAFVHAAPWSVGQQGRVNVSHGCVNLSTSNAIWFYNFALHGDIVDVYNSGAAPDTSDPGMADWNMSWAAWVAGDANPSPEALALHPKSPHDSEPAAPPYSYQPPPRTSPSPTSTPKPSPTPTRSGH
jgi:lipoprotein-anchoring transpeptidase ErfK/SrfK